ncbi:MAG: type II secretion system protein GspL [Pseudomonadota bacterium]|nr:type II secretion system protein GspL [Pseudomonadota bacterium]
MSKEIQPPNTAEPGGIWFLDGERLIRLAGTHIDSATVLVPSEQVLILAVDLPLDSRRQRLSALPFAIEDQIADPIGDVHVALGMELSPRRHLAGVVRHEVMSHWAKIVTEAGLTHCSVVPDALSLPVPEEGAWSTQAAGDRVLVRTWEGTGFATSRTQMPIVWAAAGNPVCIAYGEPLPPQVTSVPGSIELEPLTTRLLVPALDLRQGPYAKPRRSVPISARTAMAVLGAAALAHAAIAALETFVLREMADNRRAEAQALAQQYLPGVAVDADFAAEVTELLSGGAGPPRSTFFPLLVRASAALGQGAPGTTLRGLSYDSKAGELSLLIEQPDMNGLQRSEAALLAAGLRPVTGTPQVENDVAAARISVREFSAEDVR